MISRLFLLVSLLVCTWASNGSNYNIYETPENIRRDGFPAEVHHVKTSDGYILEMHRIPHGRDQIYSSGRPVVFLMHGLLAASNSFLILGPELAPAYNLADAGFDVWMGNAKGTKNSRHHVSLDPDDKNEKLDFFDFTFEQIATKDLPAMIDYTLKYTGRRQLHYIGHSQGGTVFLVLNSMLPEYNEKIASAHLLAGVGYQNYFPSVILGTLADRTDAIYSSALRLGLVELFPPNSTLPIDNESKADHCFGDGQYKYVCEQIGVKYLLGLREGKSMTERDSSPIDDYEPAGAALKQVAHYGQNIRDKTFSRWSYGTIGNIINYGSINPPKYDLSLITIKTTMHYTVNDILLDERDVLAMASVMPYTTVRKVPRESFEHVDFIGAADAKELVTDWVIAALKVESGMVK